MKKLLSYLLIVAVVISFALTGCAGIGIDSTWVSGPEDNGPDQHDGSTPSGNENEESDSSEFDWESALIGTLEIRVTDAPPEEDITSILVAISGIEIHQAATEQEEQSADGWLTLEINGTNPFDLIELRNEGVTALLTVEELASGKYTQIRLIIDEVWVTVAEGTPMEAVLSSDELKLVRPFDIEDGMATILTVDFDAAKSVHFTGQGNAIVNPVVKLTVEYNPL